MDKVIDFRRPKPAQNQSEFSKVSKLFFTLDILQVITVGSIQSTMMIRGDFRPIKEGGMGPGRQVYMALLTASIIYTCLLCLFAVRKENILEIIAFVIQNNMFMCYSFIQVYHLRFKTKYSVPVTFKKDPVLSMCVVINSGFLLIMNIIFVYLAFKLFREYGWKIYKRVRFNVNLRGVYHTYELVICLMKMNFLFVTLFAICYQQIILRDHLANAVSIVLLSIIPITLVLWIMGYIGIQKENKILMLIFTVAILAGMGTYTYLIYRLVTTTCYGCKEYFMTLTDDPREVVVTLGYLASVALIFDILLAIATLKAFCNFGKGLRNHFADGSRNSTVLLLGIHPNLNSTLANSTTLAYVSESENIDANNATSTSQDNNVDMCNNSHMFCLKDYDVSRGNLGIDEGDKPGILNKSEVLAKNSNAGHQQRVSIIRRLTAETLQKLGNFFTLRKPTRLLRFKTKKSYIIHPYIFNPETIFHNNGVNMATNTRLLRHFHTDVITNPFMSNYSSAVDDSFSGEQINLEDIQLNIQSSVMKNRTGIINRELSTGDNIMLEVEENGD